MKLETVGRRAIVLIVALCICTMFVVSTTAVDAQQPMQTNNSDMAKAVVGTAFTYQGRLNDNGNPANSSYDFQFAIFTAASGGSAVGNVLTKEDITVQDGFFTVSLDFGNNVFTGDARYLEIGVRSGSSTGGFTALSPRQAINPAPYALALPGVITKNGQVGIGTSDPQTALHVAGNRIRLQNGAKSLDLRADGGALDLWTDSAPLYLVSEKNDLHIATRGQDTYVHLNGRMNFTGADFSKAGVADHNAIISVPWGTINDWNIFVSANTMGRLELGSEGDNALIHMEIKANANNNTSWKIYALYRWRNNGDHDDVTAYPGKVNYLIVPK